MGRIDRTAELNFPAPSSSGRLMAATAACALAIVDHSRLRRECLRLAFVQHNPQWQVGDFGSAAELARSIAQGETVDLVLICAATAEHVDLVEIEAIRDALPDTPLVVVAENANAQRARQILNAGARGFLPASLSLKVLMGAVDLVLAGDVYVPSLLDSAPQPLGAWKGEDRGEPWSELTRRQRDVLALISHGKSNKLIADALTMSESTVKAHVKQIIKRLRVSNRTQAALLATGHGPFPPPVLNGGHADTDMIAK